MEASGEGNRDSCVRLQVRLSMFDSEMMSVHTLPGRLFEEQQQAEVARHAGVSLRGSRLEGTVSARAS